METWILVIMILTSNGWVENEVPNWKQEYSSVTCRRTAEYLSRHYDFLHAYCVEK